MGALKLKKNVTQYFYSVFLHFSHFPEFSGQFLQPPDCNHIEAESSLATSLWLAIEEKEFIHDSANQAYVTKEYTPSNCLSCKKYLQRVRYNFNYDTGIALKNHIEKDHQVTEIVHGRSLNIASILNFL